MFRSYSSNQPQCAIIVREASQDEELKAAHEPERSLTDEQKILLKDSFTKMQYKHFQTVLMSYLQDYPTRKALFPKLRSLSDIEIATNPTLVPARILSIGLKNLTSTLDSDLAFEMAIDKIVKNHLKYKIRKEHIEEIKPLFLTQLRELGMNDLEEEKSATAWTVLFQLLMDKHIH